MAAVHTSRDFETELSALRARALAMGERCEQIVKLAVDAFWEGSPDRATEVKAFDTQIDRDEVALHALVLRILALRQPVADDLRFLAAALKLTTDLERIGDEAVNIAERAVDQDSAPKALVRDELGDMAQQAQGMLRRALAAFVDRDAGCAELVIAHDDTVDHCCSHVIATMTDYLANHPDDVPAGLRIVRVAKYLERIADHATNVAEEVIFMVRGDDVRHFRSRCGPTGL
jgi:phosphate transport system protein